MAEIHCAEINAPVLATVEGYFSAVQGANKDKAETGTVEEFAGQKEPLPKIIAPEVLRDAGYGVDREIKVGNQKMTLRTSTENDISFTQIPEGKVRLTGIMTYYSGWQIQLRDIHTSVNYSLTTINRNQSPCCVSFVNNLF